MNERPTAIVLTSYPLPRVAELLHPFASHRIASHRCNKAAALRLYRRRLRLRHDTSQMYHNNTQQQWVLNSIAMRR